jgi:hypothetical protein
MSGPCLSASRNPRGLLRNRLLIKLSTFGCAHLSGRPATRWNWEMLVLVREFTPSFGQGQEAGAGPAVSEGRCHTFYLMKMPHEASR